MRLPKSAALALLLAVSAVASGAQAHAHLTAADPQGGADLKHPPQVIRATFSEPLLGPFSSLSLTTSKGDAVPLGKAVLADGDPRSLVAATLRPLAPGDYVVHWRAVSVDTHKTAGQYGFRITP
jgi:methionine-rich copper-binding protein CopC